MCRLAQSTGGGAQILQASVLIQGSLDRLTNEPASPAFPGNRIVSLDECVVDLNVHAHMQSRAIKGPVGGF